MSQFCVNPSPHIHHEDTIRSMMTDVCVALLPSLLWGLYAFGWRVLLLTAVSILSCNLAEAAAQKLMHRRVTLGDGSATVSGFLLALGMPHSAPLYVPMVGAVVAMVAVKVLFGGLGKNPCNPALAARAFLMIVFAAAMNRACVPFLRATESIGTVTPLRSLGNGMIPENVSVTDLLVGNVPGRIGEVSALLLLAGFLYLLVRKVITWHIPVTYLGAVFFVTLLFPKTSSRLEFALYSVLSGGVILVAVFMATDPVTSPVTTGGRLLFGALCGVLTVLIRYFVYPEGACFAVLIMNLTVRFLDRLFQPRPYGALRFGTKETV